MEDGWLKRNITDNFKVKETVELYELLGYEVKVTNYDPDSCDVECNECMKDTPEKFKVIYTRGNADMSEDLF